MSEPIRFEPAVTLREGFDGTHLYFAFQGRKIVLFDGGVHESSEPFPSSPIRSLHLGRLGDRACHAIELGPDDLLPEGFTAHDLRFVGERLGTAIFDLAGRASQILEWDRTHRFCGVCASPTKPHEKDRARVCTACGHLAYPRLSPAIIVAVERGDELLLARSVGFPQGIYSVLAGFVEPGESAEECVAREVFEEAGIEVDDIRYFGSQPWPFPHSLMLGFTARWVGGEVTPAEGEIEDAAFFHVDELPKLFRSHLSISQWLIEDFVTRRGRVF